MNLAPDVGFSEIIVIAIVALVVFQPKDLPRVMRTIGKVVGQARRMAGEFQAAFNQMAREAEMEDLRKEIEALKRDNALSVAKSEIEDGFAPVKAALADEAQKIDAAAREEIAAGAAATGAPKTPPADPALAVRAE